MWLNVFTPSALNGPKPENTEGNSKQPKKMNTLVTLTAEDIKSRVNSTNSFTKEEVAAHRSLINLYRGEKREAMAKLNGSNVGSVIDKLREENGAVVSDMKSRTSATRQVWTITLTAKVHKSEAEKLKARAAKLQKELNKVEELLENVSAPTAETTIAKA